MKKAICLIVSFVISLSFSLNAMAYAVREPRGEESGITKGKNDIYFEDFTSYEEGQLPKNMSITQNATNIIEIAAAETPDSKSKNVLKITDTSTSGAGTIKIPVPESKNPITFEMRIKHKKTVSEGYGFIMDFKDSKNNNAFRIIRYNTDNSAYTYIGSSAADKAFTSNDNKITHDDTWFTIKVRMDPQMKQTGVIIENEQIVSKDSLTSAKYSNVWPDPENNRVMGYKLPWTSEEIEKVVQIALYPYGTSQGEHFIDYIKFTENVPEFLPVRKRAESKEIETIPDPNPTLFSNGINFIFRGEIAVPKNSPVIINGRTMIDAASFAEWYGMSFSADGESYIIKDEGKNLKFKLNDLSFTLNNEGYSCDSAPQLINGEVYIPVRCFAAALGSTVGWSANPSCVTID